MATCQPQISCNKKPVMSVVYGGYEGSRCPANAIMPKQSECATHQDQMMVWKGVTRWHNKVNAKQPKTNLQLFP